MQVFLNTTKTISCQTILCKAASYKSALCLGLIILMAFKSIAAEEHIISSKKTLYKTISSSNITRIYVKGVDIESIIGNIEEFEAKVENHRNIYIKPKQHSPFEITMNFTSGKAQHIRFTPLNKDIVNKSQAKEDDGKIIILRSQSKIEKIRNKAAYALNETLRQNKKYVSINIRKYLKSNAKPKLRKDILVKNDLIENTFEENPLLPMNLGSNFKILKAGKYVNGEFIIYKFLVENSSSRLLSLKERELFQGREIVAAIIEMPLLNPGEKTVIYGAFYGKF